jgi:1-acyl-sn-glycerol-3-phosphate acyltransferase
MAGDIGSDASTRPVEAVVRGSVRFDATEPIPVVHWIRTILAMSVFAVVALLVEVWMRLGILPWHRRDSPSWHRAWNGSARRWGVWTFEVARVFLGLKVEVEGEIPTSGRYVVVSNHQSSIDIPALIYVLRRLNLKFVAHDGLKYGKPGVSMALRNGGFAFVHKKNRSEDIEELRRFAKKTEDNDGSPVIFPEGIRSFDGDMRRFHLAGTHAICEVADLALLPVVHDGLWRARTLSDVPRLVGSTVRFRVLEAVPPEAIREDPWAVYADVDRAIRDGLAEIRGESTADDEPLAVAHGG